MIEEAKIKEDMQIDKKLVIMLALMAIEPNKEQKIMISEWRRRLVSKPVTKRKFKRKNKLLRKMQAKI